MERTNLYRLIGPNPQAHTPNPYIPQKNPEEKTYIGVFYPITYLTLLPIKKSKL